MTKAERIEEIRNQIAALEKELYELNPYAELPKLSNKAFGEGWSEPYILSKVPNLMKKNGAGHDMGGKHYEFIEVKSCRKIFSKEPGGKGWTMNQIHPDEADAYLFVWYNCEDGSETICFIPTKDMIEKCSLNRQHGDGCFTLSETINNKEVLSNYIIGSWEELNEVV